MCDRDIGTKNEGEHHTLTTGIYFGKHWLFLCFVLSSVKNIDSQEVDPRKGGDQDDVGSPWKPEMKNRGPV